MSGDLPKTASDALSTLEFMRAVRIGMVPSDKWDMRSCGTFTTELEAKSYCDAVWATRSPNLKGWACWTVYAPELSALIGVMDRPWNAMIEYVGSRNLPNAGGDYWRLLLPRGAK